MWGHPGDPPATCGPRGQEGGAQRSRPTPARPGGRYRMLPGRRASGPPQCACLRSPRALGAAARNPPWRKLSRRLRTGTCAVTRVRVHRGVNVQGGNRGRSCVVFVSKLKPEPPQTNPPRDTERGRSRTTTQPDRHVRPEDLVDRPHPNRPHRGRALRAAAPNPGGGSRGAGRKSVLPTSTRRAPPGAGAQRSRADSW